MKLQYRVAHSLVLLIMKVFWNLKVIGLDKLRFTEGGIVCANHQSAFDPPFLGAVLPVESYYLAKSELFKNKFFGRILKSINAIPIRRHRFSGSSIKKCEELLKKQKTLVIFPEGSRKSFIAKPGIARIALASNAKIFPVKILNITRFKDCFFRRKNLTFIFNKPFFLEWNKNLANGKPNYKKFAQKVLDTINNIKANED